MKYAKFLLLGAISFVLINWLFTGYGNKSSHRNINSLVVEKFMSKYVNTAFQPEQLKNYLFVLNGSKTFPGTFVNAGGLTQYAIEEIDSDLNPLAWIVHGGYSADEPEVFASFRHFYDPTAPDGNRYLHNHLDEMESTGVIDNPKIDHLEWAANHSEHQYNWENGKASIVSALTNNLEYYKDKEMAFAWRALGETLHMIADMGCPAHVRDDAHAAEGFTGYKLGSPDPYEEIFEDISASEGIATIFQNGKLDQDLRTKFSNAKTIQEIAIELANYSNKNFFTTQTISGSDVIPIIHPEKTYASPSLGQCEYDPFDFMYKKNISGNEVLMCCDLKYSLGIFKGTGYPYINKECTYSQAQALLPQIVEAGANVMRLYIPELKVEITEYDQEENILKGKVTHKTNSEYTRQLKYNGTVTIYNAKSRKKITEVECEDGKFETEVKKIRFFSVDWEKYGIFGEIEFGGIYVRSENFTEKIEEPFNYISCSVECPIDFITYDGDYTGRSFSIGTGSSIPDRVEFTKTSFIIEHSDSEMDFWASGTISDRFINTIKIRTLYQSYTGSVMEYKTDQSIELKNLKIPMTAIDSVIAFSTSYVINGEVGQISSLKYLGESYYNGKMYTGSEIIGYDENKFAKGGVIRVAFRKY